MNPRRTGVNVLVFMAISALLVFLGATTLVFQKGGGRTLNLNFADAAGLVSRNDVTMRGVPVGAVSNVTLMSSGTARVSVQLQPGITVPGGTKAQITRRSPIGDLVLDLTPGTGPALPSGATIALADTTGPPDPEKTIEALARVLHAVPSQDLGSLISELSAAVDGRGQDLATISKASADLPERILQVEQQLRALIETGPKVMDVLAQNSHALADDITQTAVLAGILRDRRYDLVNLMKNGASFAQVAGGLIASEKPNLACLIADFGNVNSTLAQRQHLADLESALDLNHYFFDAVWQAVQDGTDGLRWFRVKLLPFQQPAGRAYAPHRPPPNVYPGNACLSRYGPGVGPVTQPGAIWVAPGSKVFPG